MRWPIVRDLESLIDRYAHYKGPGPLFGAQNVEAHQARGTGTLRVSSLDCTRYSSIWTQFAWFFHHKHRKQMNICDNYQRSVYASV